MAAEVVHHRAGSIATCGIAVMAKASIPGCTKTRLVPPLTLNEASAFNTMFIRDVADTILIAAKTTSLAGYMAFGPPASMAFFRENLPKEVGLIDAWYPSLGECLLSAISQLLGRGHRKAVVLNCDSPTLPPSILIAAVDVLALPGDRAVLGPADDGGYYLLGVKHAHPRLFEDIAWSTAHVTRQTLERAAELNIPVHVLPRWYDVDDVRALRMLHAELFDGWCFSPRLRPHRPPHTAALMQSLIEHSDLLQRLACDAWIGRAAEPCKAPG